MTPLGTSRSNTSTLFERLNPAQRQKLDKAIVDRSPPTFTACYEAHQLADRGISFDAFYRYARRLRTQSELQKMAELTVSADEDAEKILPRIISQQLLEMMLAEEPSPDVIHRLANAYRQFVTAQVARRRLDFAEIEHKESERRREISDLTDNYIKINRLKLADIHGDLALAKAAGLPPPANPGEPTVPPANSPPTAPTNGHTLNTQSVASRPEAPPLRGRSRENRSCESKFGLGGNPFSHGPSRESIPDVLPPAPFGEPFKAPCPSDLKKTLLDKIDLSVEAALKARRSPSARGDIPRKKSRPVLDTG